MSVLTGCPYSPVSIIKITTAYKHYRHIHTGLATSNKQVFFFYKYVNIFIQIEAKPVKNASSFLLFSGHSELKTGPLSGLACENIRFSSLFVDGDVSGGGTSATQRQKFHTDDTNQCLHNRSSCHGGSKYKFVQFCLSSGRFW